MKWRAKKPPAPGDVRHRRKFAWLPVETVYEFLPGRTEEWTVWLESYQVREVYEVRRIPDGNGWSGYGNYLDWYAVARFPLFSSYGY